MRRDPKPAWLTFDCYGTLIQWDEGLIAAVDAILATRRSVGVSARQVMERYDRYEHELEQARPHRRFLDVAGSALRMALEDFGLHSESSDIELLTTRISSMPPFPEVVGALAELKAAGFRLCIISNTDDAIIAGNVVQLGGHVDRVITAEHARAYKPSPVVFEYAFREIGVATREIVHICASPQLDHTAARGMGFRCIWINRATGRELLPDYTPDAVFPALDHVPGYLRSIGWIP